MKDEFELHMLAIMDAALNNEKLFLTTQYFNRWVLNAQPGWQTTRCRSVYMKVDGGTKYLFTWVAPDAPVISPAKEITLREAISLLEKHWPDRHDPTISYPNDFELRPV